MMTLGMMTLGLWCQCGSMTTMGMGWGQVSGEEVVYYYTVTTPSRVDVNEFNNTVI